MQKRSDRHRIQRLEELTTLLQAGEFLTIAQLAESLGVSGRTLSRDLELLRERGLPIEADRGRGGGVQLHRNWRAGKVNLSTQESIDLLISLAVAEKMNSPIFMGNTASIRRKIIASFGADLKTKVQRLGSRIYISSPASGQVLSGFKPSANKDVELIHRAFVEMCSMDIQYQDEQGRKTQRHIEPHYVMLSYPVWYLLAWDNLRDDIRMFRFDRIGSIELGSGFKLHHRKEFLTQLEHYSQSI